MSNEGKEINDKGVREQISAIAEELKGFRTRVEERIDLIEKKLSPDSYQGKIQSQGYGEQIENAVLSDSSAKKRVRIHEVYQISEDVAEAVVELQLQIRRALPPKSRKRIHKSVVAEMALRLGIIELQDEHVRNKQVRNFLS